MPRPSNTADIIDKQDGNRVYPMNIKRAKFLIAAFPGRFVPVDISDFYPPHKGQKEDETMPAMPKQATRLEDGTYNFKVIKCETTKGEFGAQEEMTLAVLDDEMEETGQNTRAWIGHKSYKTIMAAIEAGVCSATYPDDDPENDPEAWEVKVPVMFRGIVIDGKIKKFKRA